jgi:hypothetical protein
MIFLLPASFTSADFKKGSMKILLRESNSIVKETKRVKTIAGVSGAVY